jgi:hypothetical protein
MPNMPINDSFNYSGAVTKSDSTVLDFNALYVGTTGSVVIKHAADGADTTFTSVPAGAILPVHGVRVMAATGASNIVWLRY